MKHIRQAQLRTAAAMLETDRRYSVTPRIIQHYAPKGKWKEWHDYDGKAIGRPTYIKKGKTLADRITQYTRLCKQAGKKLTTERAGEVTILRNCTGWAHFIESPDEELTALRKDHRVACKYWARLANELATGHFFKVV